MSGIRNAEKQLCTAIILFCDSWKGKAGSINLNIFNTVDIYIKRDLFLIQMKTLARFDFLVACLKN